MSYSTLHMLLSKIHISDKYYLFDDLPYLSNRTAETRARKAQGWLKDGLLCSLAANGSGPSYWRCVRSLAMASKASPIDHRHSKLVRFSLRRRLCDRLDCQGFVDSTGWASLLVAVPHVGNA